MIAVVRKVPVDRFTFQRLGPLEQRRDAHSIDVLRRPKRQAHHLQDRGIEVGADHGRVAYGSPLALVRPVDDQRFANTTFVKPAFGSAQRKVRCREGLVQLISRNFPVGISEVRCGHAAIVRKQDHDRVVIEVQSLQFGQHAAKALVDRLDHGRKLNVVLMLFDLDGAIRQNLVSRPRWSP